MKKKLLILPILSGLALTGCSTTDNKADAKKWYQKGDTIVKCQGVTKKGMNDCGANGHSCSGNAKVDRDDKEWVYLPQGVCEKIVGGVVWKKKVVK